MRSIAIVRRPYHYRVRCAHIAAFHIKKDYVDDLHTATLAELAAGPAALSRQSRCSPNLAGVAPSLWLGSSRTC